MIDSSEFLKSVRWGLNYLRLKNFFKLSIRFQNTLDFRRKKIIFIWDFVHGMARIFPSGHSYELMALSNTQTMPKKVQFLKSACKKPLSSKKSRVSKTASLGRAYTQTATVLLPKTKEQMRLFSPLQPNIRSNELPRLTDPSQTIRRRLEIILTGDLNFHDSESNYASHVLHAFAAKFPPQLPGLFIREFTQPGDIVLDPMMGSGTTILEAFLEKRRAI